MGFDLGLLLPNAGTPGLRLVEYPAKLLKHQLVHLLAGRPILLFPVQAQLFQQPLVFQKGRHQFLALVLQFLVLSTQLCLQSLVFRSGNGHHFFAFFGEFFYLFHA